MLVGQEVTSVDLIIQSITQMSYLVIYITIFKKWLLYGINDGKTVYRDQYYPHTIKGRLIFVKPFTYTIDTNNLGDVY